MSVGSYEPTSSQGCKEPPKGSGKGVLVAEKLLLEYGRSDLGNKADPLDELIYISLTRQTHEKNALRTWEALTTTYLTWEMLLEAPESEVASVIADGGFSRQKAKWIQQSLRLIKERSGSLSLDFLDDLADREAEQFLCSLPGINVKSAKCILMYSLERDVLPVDTHVRRVSERLGLLEPVLAQSVLTSNWNLWFHHGRGLHIM